MTSEMHQSPPAAPLPIVCAVAAPSHPRRVARLAARLPALLALAFFALFILLPLAVYFAGFLAHPVAVLRVVLSTRAEAARLAVLLARTLSIAALAATLALGAGLAVATAALWLSPRAGRFLLALAALPFFIPATVAAIAWIQAFGQAGWVTHALSAAGLPSSFLPSILYSSPGCALALALHDYPIVLALAWLGWRGAGRAALESGATFLPPVRLWFAVALGWLRPWLAAGWLLVFMRALHEYSLPLLLRCHVFSVEIVSAFNIDYRPERALALALPLVALSLAGVALLARILANVRWPADPGRVLRLPVPGRAARAMASTFAGLIVLPAVGIPLVTLLLQAGSWNSYASILLSAREQISASLLHATLASIAAVLLAAALTARNFPGTADVPVRNPHRQPASSRIKQIFLPALVFGLIGLPASVVALSQIAFWNRPGWAGLPGRFYDSGLVLTLGLLILALPVAWLVLRARLRETPRVLIESQLLQPLHPWRAAWRLFVPRLARPALLALGLAFVLAMQESQASLLLAAPGQETMSTRAMTLLHNAPDALVAAFCIILIVLIAAGLAALWGAKWLLNRWSNYEV